jgi:hypothetical protein
LDYIIIIGRQQLYELPFFGDRKSKMATLTKNGQKGTGHYPNSNRVCNGKVGPPVAILRSWDKNGNWSMK